MLSFWSGPVPQASWFWDSFTLLRVCAAGLFLLLSSIPLLPIACGATHMGDIWVVSSVWLLHIKLNRLYRSFYWPTSLFLLGRHPRAEGLVPLDEYVFKVCMWGVCSRYMCQVSVQGVSQKGRTILYLTSHRDSHPRQYWVGSVFFISAILMGVFSLF